MFELIGARQRYAWGSANSIPSIIGIEPDGEPWAEAWFGTHPNGPSHLVDGRRLDEVAEPLPYLVKLLAAEQPLSLQTHPSAAQAASGFEQGVFGDPYAKPEIIIALTTFEAVSGFRPFDETDTLLRSWGVEPFTFADVMRAPVDRALFTKLATVDHPLAEWARRLHTEFPEDPAAAALLLLNHVVLEPGEALYLDAGNLHAYLHGTGVEVMGASDNVVRGGLTPKHVDIDLLLAVTRVQPLAQPRARFVDGAFETPGAPFTVRLDRDRGGLFACRFDEASRSMELVVELGAFTVTPI